jgi:hypothetical protein
LQVAAVALNIFRGVANSLECLIATSGKKTTKKKHIQKKRKICKRSNKFCEMICCAFGGYKLYITKHLSV